MEEDKPKIESDEETKHSGPNKPNEE